MQRNKNINIENINNYNSDYDSCVIGLSTLPSIIQCGSQLLKKIKHFKL